MTLREFSGIIGTLCLVFCLLTVARGGEPGEGVNDTVHLGDNSAMNVKIVQDDWRGVRFKTSLAEKSPVIFQAVNRVVGTEYGDILPEFDQGQVAINKREYEKAVKLFSAGLKKEKDSKRKQYYLVGLADAHLKLGQVDEARKQFKMLVSITPAPRLIYDSYLKYADTFAREKKYAEAEKIFKNASEFFKKLGDSKDAPRGVKPYIRKFRFTALLNCLLMIERQGEKVMAEKRLKSQWNLFIARSAAGTPKLNLLGKLGKARALSASGEDKEAIDLVEKVLKESKKAKLSRSDLTELLAYGNLAKGDVSFKKLDYHQARWYYLSVIVRFSGNRAIEAQSHLKAGLCYEKLASSKVNRESDGLGKAARHYKIIVGSYQDSLEALQAKDRLEALNSGGARTN
jgi:tetratricopeptide (TPR) repeat protein